MKRMQMVPMRIAMIAFGTTLANQIIAMGCRRSSGKFVVAITVMTMIYFVVMSSGICLATSMMIRRSVYIRRVEMNHRSAAAHDLQADEGNQ